MKRSLIWTALSAAALAVPMALVPGLPATGNWPGGQPGAAHAQASVSIGIFFDELAPHGRWLRTSRYGYVFVPASIDDDWRPYTHGHWIYTAEYGWLWVSDEPFGWATYHYGRWGYNPDYGWFWVPGTAWAPAWVSWSSSDDYIGWAPLPPSGSGYASILIGPVAVGVGAWRFVAARDFLAPRLNVIILEPRRNPEIYRRVRPMGAVRVVQNRVVNNIITVNTVERVVNRKIEVHKVVERGDRRPGRLEVKERAVEVNNPRLVVQTKEAPKQTIEARQLTDQSKQVAPDSKARGKNLAAKEAPAAAPADKGPRSAGTKQPPPEDSVKKGPDAKGAVEKTDPKQKGKATQRSKDDEPKQVTPKQLTPKQVTPKKDAEPKQSVAPLKQAPVKEAKPKAVAPKAVAPKAVEPKAVVPKVVEPKAQPAPKAKQPVPSAAQKSAPQPSAGAPTAAGDSKQGGGDGKAASKASKKQKAPEDPAAAGPK